MIEKERMREIITNKIRYKRKTAKSIILIGLLDAISLELARYFLQIPFFSLYSLLFIVLFIIQLLFLFFFDFELQKKDLPKKVYRINDYLTLKLENNTTNIYVNEKQFTQCKFLLLTIPLDKIKEFDDIESIDEAAEKLDHQLEYPHGIKIKIPPETEFWAHCSNLQVWAEYNYNPRLLHSNLAFPLLKALTDGGDPIAKEVIKQEIKFRFESFNPSTQEYLIKNGYLNYFNEEEQKQIFRLIFDENIWINFGYKNLNDAKNEKALESFLQARNINPINLKTLLGIVQVYVKTEKYEKALQVYNEILEYYPENLKAIVGKDLILQKIKNI